MHEEIKPRGPYIVSRGRTAVKHCPGALGSSMNLGGWGLKMRRNKVPCKSQLYSEHLTVYTLGVNKSHLGKVHQKDKIHMVNPRFFPQRR